MLGLVGESGSGKSSFCQTILRLYEPQEAAIEGRIFFQGKDLLSLSEKDFAPYRGRKIGMVFQDPIAALDPVHTIRHDMTELLPPRQRRAAGRDALLIEHLKRAGIEDAERVLKAYPHELSGGLKQRVLIALSLMWDPDLLLADEPTTALDVSTQKDLMELFQQLKKEGRTILFVTHDLSLLDGFADRICVMKDGVLLEDTEADRFFQEPQHPYSRELLNAVPSLLKRQGKTSAPTCSAPPERAERKEEAECPVLELEQLSKHFGGQGLFRRKTVVQAVDQVSFRLRRGRCAALVGESASGKTTCARLIAGLIPCDGGRVLYEGKERDRLPAAERRELQMIFQNPLTSFDPRQRMDAAFAEIEKLAGLIPSRERRENCLRRMGLPAGSLEKRPFEFSGGQAQRLAIARALLLHPRLLILDESLAGLDLLAQQRILELLRQVQAEEALTYLFITHDLRAVRQLADQVLVMEKGKLREDAPVEAFFAAPQAAYSQKLLASVPRFRNEREPA